MQRHNRIATLSSELADTADRILRRQSPQCMRLDNGIWIATTGEAWLYAAMPQAPLLWEDADKQRSYAQNLQSMFVELANSASAHHGDPEFHLLALGWQDAPRAGPQVDPGVREWLRPVFSGFSVGASLFVVGVKLRPVKPRPHERLASLLSGRPPLNERSVDRMDKWPTLWDRDIAMAVLDRAGARRLSHAECDRMSLWLGGGLEHTPALESGAHEYGSAAWDALYGPEGIQFSVPVDFTRLESSDGVPWLATAFGHLDDNCLTVSIRGTLTADPLVEHGYDDRTLVHRCSVVIVHRRSQDTSYSFTTHMAEACGVESLTLVGDQRVEALAETLPLGQPRLGASRSPRSGMPVSVLARSGIGAFHAVGDEAGAWIGASMPDRSLVWLDPFAAAKRGAPPIVNIVGDPGKGKTFLLRMIADEMASTDMPVVYVNPKAADSAEDFAEQARADFVKVSSLEQGALDPFRFATTPERAAELAAEHILTFLPSIHGEEAEHLTTVLRLAAQAGARCVGEALAHPEMRDFVREQVTWNAASHPLFGLGISKEPLRPWRFADLGRFAVIEFDRTLPWPVSCDSMADLDSSERAAVTAMRLVVHATIEQMCVVGQGVLLVDEADAVMAAGGDRRIERRLQDVGTSHGILPIMSSQKPIKPSAAAAAPWQWGCGRVLVMGMEDVDDVQKSLALCGLEYSEQKHDFLRLAGPHTNPDDPSRNRGALGFYRDFDGRLSAVLIGPLPDDMRQRFATDPLSHPSVATQRQ